MNDPLLGTKPSELRVRREPVPERAEVPRDLFEAPADDEVPKRVDGRDDHLVAAADGERQPMPLDAGIRRQHDICGRVIGIDVHRIGARERLGCRKAEIEDVEIADDHGAIDTECLEDTEGHKPQRHRDTEFFPKEKPSSTRRRGAAAQASDDPKERPTEIRTVDLSGRRRLVARPAEQAARVERSENSLYLCVSVVDCTLCSLLSL